ncbi:MAG: DUF4395 domain-containing protein [Haloarcula sp.]
MGKSDAEPESTVGGTADVTMIDPRAPRFGQTITMTVLLLGIGLQEPLFILAIAVILTTAVLSGWQLTFYGFLWRQGMLPLVGQPEETEPAAPHRFAKVMGAGMSTFATILLFGAPVTGLPTLTLVGYTVALVHAIMAAIGGVGDYCIGCRMYRQVAFFRRLGVV